MARAGPGGIPVELSKSLRFESPEEEEASALETLGTAGIASMGPRVRRDYRRVSLLPYCLVQLL